MIEQAVGRPLTRSVPKVSADLGLFYGVNIVVVENHPLGTRLNDRYVMAVRWAHSDVDYYRPQLVETIGIGNIVGRIEQSQFEGKYNPIGEFDVSLQTFFVLEAFEVKCEKVWELLDFHSLLGLLQSAAFITRELVPLTQHLARTELPQA